MSKEQRTAIQAFFDEATYTVSICFGPRHGAAAVIDPVLDYDHKGGTVDVRSVEKILKEAEARNLRIEWFWRPTPMPITSPRCARIKGKTGAKIGIGEHIKDVQRIFRPIFNADDLKTDGKRFRSPFQGMVR